MFARFAFGSLWLAVLFGLTLATAQAYWVPTFSDTFQWDLEQPVPLDVDASVYDIDLFANPASVVAALHAAGRHAICYIDVGSWESYRPDAKSYPKIILGNRYPGYPQERFVDIRRLDLLGPILQKRFDLCRSKGFDAIEPDNIDTYQAKTGFPLTAADEITFNMWLIGQAHARNLSIGQKNDPAQASQLVGSFDWALLEECFFYRFCGQFSRYVAAGKAVFDTEYTTDTSLSRFLKVDCADDQPYGFYLIYKHLSLDAYRVTCAGMADADSGGGTPDKMRIPRGIP